MRNAPAGPQDLRAQRVEDWPPQTRNNVQTDRDRVEARQQREAAQIERDQLTRVHKAEMGMLQGLVEENHRECMAVMARLRREWGQARAIERGELAEEDVEAENGQGNALAEMGDEMEVGSDYVPTETSSTAGDDDRDERSSWFLTRPSLT